MSKKLTTTISVVFALATAAAPATALADPNQPPPNNQTPTSPGACNMLHTSDTGLAGMMNDTHVYDIMIPLVVASLTAGCAHP